jgi:hypothetical protein
MNARRPPQVAQAAVWAPTPWECLTVIRDETFHRQMRGVLPMLFLKSRATAAHNSGACRVRTIPDPISVCAVSLGGIHR